MNRSKIEYWQLLADDRGWSLMPIVGKTAILSKWQRWCNEKRIFEPREFQSKNAAICCGPASGIIVLDIDIEDKFQRFSTARKLDIPETLEHGTGGGGRHLIY